MAVRDVMLVRIIVGNLNKVQHLFSVWTRIVMARTEVATGDQVFQLALLTSFPRPVRRAP